MKTEKISSQGEIRSDALLQVSWKNAFQTVTIISNLTSLTARKVLLNSEML